MMRIFHGYFGDQLARGYLPVAAIFLALFSLVVLVDEIDDVGRAHYTFLRAIEFVALTVPGRLVFLAPFIALLGSIMALGGLANGRELLAMQASGLSPYQIAGIVMKYGVVFILAIAVMEQFVTPVLDQQAFLARSLALSESTAYQSKQGFWFKDAHRYVRIRSVLYGEVPQGIDVFEFDANGHLSRYLHAKEANLENPQQWVLKEVEEKVIHGQEISRDYRDMLAWGALLNQDEMRVLTLPTSALSPTDLYQFVNLLQRKGQNSRRYELAFWEKVFRPLNTAVMILVAVPFVFGALRAATMGKRVLMGVMTGLGYYMGAQVLEQAGMMLGWPPLMTVLVPFGATVALTFLFWRFSL